MFQLPVVGDNGGGDPRDGLQQFKRVRLDFVSDIALRVSGFL